MDGGRLRVRDRVGDRGRYRDKVGDIGRLRDRVRGGVGSRVRVRCTLAYMQVSESCHTLHFLSQRGHMIVSASQTSLL